MPRLGLELRDSWTLQRRTCLEFRRGELRGSGISLDVWQHLFDFHDGTWHAGVQGADVALVSLVISSRERSLVLVGEYPDIDWTGISSLVESLPFRAFPLFLGDGDLKNLRGGLRSGSVRAFLRLHDDSFFVLTSSDPRFLANAARLIVRVHEHYLGIDLDSAREEEVAKKVVEVLDREGSIQLESDPTSCTTRVRSEVAWFRRLLGRRQSTEEVLSLTP